MSIDFEDWHQLVRRRAGMEGWERPGPALAGQVATTLALLRELDVRSTFFILGIAARAHPDLVREIAGAGHEIACHGDAHVPVHSQAPEQFAQDVRAACSTIEEITGIRPRGYRAPAFSITSRTPWAYRILSELGFAYDASRCDSPLLRDRPPGPPGAPGRIEDADLWELPVAARSWGGRPIPLGGASYWSLIPTALVLKGLEDVGAWGGLYLHPYELDSRPLRPLLSGDIAPAQRARTLVRTARRNAARRRAVSVLRAVAQKHELTTYAEAHARLSGAAGS